MRMLFAAALSALALALSGAAAFAFTDEPTPSGPEARSQFSDPDEAVENLANGAAGNGGTDVSTGAQTPSGPASAQTLPPAPGDAEPVNPNWPAWMVWHQN
jgi:hypothetical protein